jgi:hypothetical protein
MTNNKLRVGIAGYGVVGKRRRLCIDLHPLLQTIAVCDRSFPDDGQMFFLSVSQTTLPLR